MSKIFSGVMQFAIKLAGRSLLKMAGAGILAWLLSHNADPTQAQAFVDYLVAAGTIGLGFSLSWRNQKDSDAKAAHASAASFDAGVAHAKVMDTTDAAYQNGIITGAEQQRAKDGAKAAAVAQAMKSAALASRQDKAAVVQALNQGSF